MASLIEEIRKENGILIEWGEVGYSIRIRKDGVVVNGCDCSSVMDDKTVEEVHEALGALLRIRRNAEKKGKTR